MPCGDPGGGCDHGPALRCLRLLTRYACAQFKAGRPVPAYLTRWWKDHRAEDRQRIVWAREARGRQQEERAARAKLTARERQLLGLK